MQVKRVAQLSVSIVLASAFLSAVLIGLAASDIQAASGARPSADCSRLIAFGSNLIVNGDAEADVGATNHVSVVSPSCWTVESNLTVVSYTVPGSPTTTFGLNYFAGGPGTAISTATQTITVSSLASMIDKNVVEVSLKGWLGGYSVETDTMTVKATFRSQTLEQRGELTIGPITADARDDTTKLLPLSAMTKVPTATRQIVITMVAIRQQGTFNDGYADDLSLILNAYQVFLPVIRR
jgi:hypothetical protein